MRKPQYSLSVSGIRNRATFLNVLRKKSPIRATVPLLLEAKKPHGE